MKPGMNRDESRVKPGLKREEVETVVAKIEDRKRAERARVRLER
jgi:hypothetical protein